MNEELSSTISASNLPVAVASPASAVVCLASCDPLATW
eukprot:CAMPEP_0181198432 /NCGR_PEP_ID=MMETSP1096-20121128/16614_1 /TAXON_ID=156174 ORGANISM="Chrysochromulina ericina, Strain CCMP281" /NCGR_SAMPLE_ID=MMETSP1096 /ASSEMBLY_ACC=CAM_ASM_000453 /LENGTH=37 /DNA_ID= /DNA_START= /DNA_END= /DNA_ORIENTATION=